MNEKQLTLWGIIARTTVVHTLTYFAVGLIAFSLFNYSAQFSDPALSSFMRQTDDPLVGWKLSLATNESGRVVEPI